MVHGIPWCPCRSVFGSNDSAARLTFLAAGGMATSVAFNKGRNVSQIISTAHWSVMCLCKTLLTQRNRFKSVYSAWPLLPINVVSLNMSFHSCSSQAANAHFTTLTVFIKGEHFTLLLVITRNAFHRQNYPRISPSLSGNCYTQMVPGRWIYSPQDYILSFTLHIGSISESIYTVFNAVFCIRANVTLVLLYKL